MTRGLTDKGCEALQPARSRRVCLAGLDRHYVRIRRWTKLLSDEERFKRRQKFQETYSVKAERIHNVDQLIRAYCIYERDNEYVVQDNQVIIVDEYTGRLMAGRRWSDGLHQAVEAKEGVKIERETQTLATVTIQNYFRMYDKLAGMTGTAETEADEFAEIYKLDVMVIPTNRPVRRVDHNDQIYKTQREKFNAIIKEIEQCHKNRQPVLVGTVSVETSELLSRMLRRQNIPHSVLNAKQHEREADIVIRAGQPGAVTIATNMAGRGTDIKLGEGVVYLKPEELKSQMSLDSSYNGSTLEQALIDKPCGLYVIASERHESRRIDRQLRGRCARQGDPGASRFYISLEDELMRLFGSDKISKFMERMGIEEGQELEHGLLNKSIERAQRRVEQHNFSIRKRTLEYDDVMNKQREIIYSFRKEVLTAENMRDHLYEIIEDVVQDQALVFSANEEEEAAAEFVSWADGVFPIALKLEDVESLRSNPEAVTEIVMERVKKAYELKSSAEEPEHLVILERQIILRTIDNHWQEYLRSMDSLRQGVGLRAYGQKDPLIEYKHEAYEMFSDLMDRIKEDVAGHIFRSATSVEAMQKFVSSLSRKFVHEEASAMGSATAQMQAESQAASRNEAALKSAVKQAKTPIQREEPKVGRNDPCPCGSGKKYKKCHGA